MEFKEAESHTPSSRTLTPPQLHSTDVFGVFEELEILITVTDTDAIFRGTNLKDSSKHNYLWIPTIFGHIYNSVTFCRVSR